MNGPEWVKFADVCEKVQQECIDWVEKERGMEDGGTCNHDSIMLNTFGVRQTTIDTFNKISKVTIGDKMSGMWRSHRIIRFKTYGQAALRTAMVEFIKQKLKEHNYDVSIYYAMD